MEKKRIALVTTWFPPQQSVATNRMLAFAEFLSEKNEVIVFGLGPENKTGSWSENVTVHYFKANSVIDKLRSKQSDPRFVHLCKTAIKIVLTKVTRNPLSKWQAEVTKKLSEEHAKNPFDVVISSFAPQETHLAVVGFMKDHPSVRWIADMRDEMSMNPGLDNLQKQRMREVEQQIDQYATAITSVSQPILDDFKKLCPHVKYFGEIRNGFNHSLVNSRENSNSRFTMGYFGSFYGGRKPVTFFSALEELKKEHPDFDFEFHIVGAHRNFEIPNSVADNVLFLPPLKYEDAIKKMMTMDANLVIHPRSEQKGVFTGKLFDYISVNVPVLAFVDKDDVAAQLVLDFNAGYVGECNDKEVNKRAIWECYIDWKNNKVKIVSEENRMSLHRKNQVAKLQLLIDQILKQ